MAPASAVRTGLAVRRLSRRGRVPAGRVYGAGPAQGLGSAAGQVGGLVPGQVLPPALAAARPLWAGAHPTVHASGCIHVRAVR
eukprot:11366967-Alexandrium_andersonii.AAC.1